MRGWGSRWARRSLRGLNARVGGVEGSLLRGRLGSREGGAGSSGLLLSCNCHGLQWEAL